MGRDERRYEDHLQARARIGLRRELTGIEAKDAPSWSDLPARYATFPPRADQLLRVKVPFLIEMR